MSQSTDQRPPSDSPEYTPEVGLLGKIPIGYARRHLLLPCTGPEGELVLLAGDPSDSFAIDETRFLVGPVRVVPIPPETILRMIDSAYEKVQTPEREIVEGLSGEWELDVEAAIEETRDLLESPDEGPVIKFVHSLIFRAIRERSSDIHVEPYEKELAIRNRIDGVLYPMVTAPRKWHAPVVSRIKVMAGLDIAERRLPQDGRIRIRVGGKEIDIRISVVPTSFGERTVLRILDRSSLLLGLEDVGLDPGDLSTMLRILSRSNGILLVTGPTGSGKTTTLYGALRRLDSGTKNIITIEDPVEYQIRGIGQIQVNPKIHLTFASGLRSILRQDPDIIMVGEIRDKETADIAFQAAMTGHLVLSTLHTNDTVATLSRLVDMGVDRFKISPGLLAITAQRLVRRLCPLCRQQVPAAEASPAILQALAAHGLEKTCYRAVGCKSCEMSGYAGRTSIVELLLINGKVKELINNNATAEDITRAAIETCALRTMTRDALWNMATGQADLKEVEPYLKLEKDQGARPAPAPAAPAAAVPAAQTPSPAMPAGKPRVMVADDDPVMRMLLKKFIENSGYEAIEAADGEEALTKIAEGPAPDLLISDINMPRMNGYDLVKGVRGALGLLDLPVIMLTTESSDKSQELAFQMGADDYVMKPFKGPLVMARVTAALRRAGRVK